MAEDERFVPSSNLIANAAEATEIFANVFAGHDLAHWQKVLEDEPGVWGALATPRETLNDPQVEPNGYVVTNVDDAGVKYRIVGFWHHRAKPLYPAHILRAVHHAASVRCLAEAGADHAVAGDKIRKLLFAPILRAFRPDGNNEITNLRSRIPHFDGSVRRQGDAELG